MYRMLLINPGSTSTKIAVFEDENNVYEKTLRHTAEELAPFPTVASQKDFRKDVIIKLISIQISISSWVGVECSNLLRQEHTR